MKREELLGRRIPDVLNPGVFETTLKNKLDECFQGKIVQFEMRYTYGSRGLVWADRVVERATARMNAVRRTCDGDMQASSEGGSIKYAKGKDVAAFGALCAKGRCGTIAAR